MNTSKFQVINIRENTRKKLRETAREKILDSFRSGFLRIVQIHPEKYTVGRILENMKKTSYQEVSS